jgi:hypothetical protein
VVTLGDDFAVPSLAAAVLLGLREQVGGHPDHIRVEHIVDPTLSDGSDNHDAILLHDVVPGGTGYLAEMATPEVLRDLLTRAWELVRTCECRHEERLACHRCLLPFVPPGAVRRASRASAERHLGHLLGLAPDADSAEGAAWVITEVPPQEDPESHLEQRFRKLIAARLKTLGAAVTEVPKTSGNALKFTLPGAPRQWTLTPQVNLENSRPDFVLETNDTSVPTVAVFTDGRRFHATTTHNRLAEDAEKREILRDTGRVVLGVTAQDVADAERGAVSPPVWFSEQAVGQLIKRPEFMATPAAYENLRKGPVDWLIDWIFMPVPESVRTVARAVPMFLLAAANPVQIAEGVPLTRAAQSALLGEDQPAAGTRRVMIRRRGALAVAVELGEGIVDIAVVLDDRDTELDEAHASAWRQWLQLSNALALRDWPTAITTTSLSASAATAAAPTPAASAAEIPAGLSSEWALAYETAAPGWERRLVLILAKHGGLPVPVIGAEGPQGIPLDISWPRLHITVASADDMLDEDRDDLKSAGWHIVDANADAVVAAISAAATTGAGSDEQGAL